MKEDQWGLFATVLSGVSFSLFFGLGSTDIYSLAFVLLFCFIVTLALSSFCLLEIQGVERGLFIFFLFFFSWTRMWERDAGYGLPLLQKYVEEYKSWWVVIIKHAYLPSSEIKEMPSASSHMKHQRSNQPGQPMLPFRGNASVCLCQLRSTD
jgi:hypothetical protein